MKGLIVPARFNGPEGSANGGWICGALAVKAHGPATVQLRLPPPLETRFDVNSTDSSVELRHGADVVALAVRRGPDTWSEVEPVDVETAEAAESHYAGLRVHPFPTCFTCGPRRAPGDGLRIFPGPVGEGRVAATWTPDPSVGDEDGVVSVPVSWAAMDCVGGWSSDLEHRPMVLAQMAAHLESRPQVGRRYVVVGQLIRVEGRKTWTAAVLLDAEDGHVVGRAEHLWIAVDWATPQSVPGEGAE